MSFRTFFASLQNHIYNTQINIFIPLAVIPWIITALGFVIDPAVVCWFAFVVNLLLIYAVFLLVYPIVRRVWISWLITSIAVMIPSVINFFKLKINGLPLVISDISFGDNFAELAEFTLPQLRFTPPLVCAVLLFVGVTALLIFAERRYRVPRFSELWTGMAGLLAALTALLPITSSGIASYGGSLSPEEYVIRYGAVAGLYCSVSNKDAVAVINPEEIAEVIGDKEDRANPSGIKPTVIYLMSESFFDVNRLPGVEFSRDPLENFRRIGRNYSGGNFISYTYCGGTGFVEMEVITGLSNYFLDAAHTLDSLPEEVYSSMPCIGDIYEKNGYTTAFVHSHTGELYNRPQIYRSFGFDDIRFRDDFSVDKEYSGGYVSDMTLAREIISMYEAKGDKPLMLFAVSMENHQPYLTDKYSQKSDITITADSLNRKETDILETFVHGISNADAALGKLVDYFSEVEEPVMIVFWGDHLPNLGFDDGINLYSKLGYTSEEESYKLQAGELMDMVTTDYVIWDNFGMKKTRRTVGSTSFGVRVADMIGLEMTDYYAWFSDRLMDRYLMCRPRLYAIDERRVFGSVPTSHKKMMDDYAAVINDIVYGDNELFEKFRK